MTPSQSGQNRKLVIDIMSVNQLNHSYQMWRCHNFQTTTWGGVTTASTLSCTLFWSISRTLQNIRVSSALFASDLVIWTKDKISNDFKNKSEQHYSTSQCFVRFGNQMDVQKTSTSSFLAITRQHIKMYCENIFPLDRQINNNDYIRSIKEIATQYWIW